MREATLMSALSVNFFVSLNSVESQYFFYFAVYVHVRGFRQINGRRRHKRRNGKSHKRSLRQFSYTMVAACQQVNWLYCLSVC